MASTAKFDSTVFYRGWLDTARKMLPSDQVSELVIALIEYGLDGKKPKKFPSDVAEAIFLMAVPSIDTNIKKKVGGRKGGRPRKDKTENKKTIGLNNVDVDADVDVDAYTSTNVDVNTPLRSAPALGAEPPTGVDDDKSGEHVEEKWEWHNPEEYISSKKTMSSDLPESKG